ncbi:MAG: bi-domain-containing oxidoreductase [Actinobacteria bacterium]|nr:bi-domain-containing oxidoreductase [Actinomycetota bacterium]
MKQVFNKKGIITVEEVPSPTVSDDEILVQVYYSCISTGTEIAAMKNLAKPLYKKALEKPQNVKKVLEMIREKGLTGTISRVKSKLDFKNPVGYSASGIVLETGKNIKNIKPGENVACVGAGISNHSEFIAVPENLAVRIPGELSIRKASTVALGAIALQGVRRCALQIGDSAVVIGLGIIGQITIQLLKISGCRVIGIDLDQGRIDKAAGLAGLNMGINPKNLNAVEEVAINTGGYGADAVIITAASSSDSIINQSIEMCRRKGKVVIVGDVSLNIKREAFYKKELDLLMSTSYGPGRYDEEYELKNLQYPYSYVKWTENRNMEEYLKLLSENKINIDGLIEKCYPVEEAEKAYNELKSEEKPLVVLLEYNTEIKPAKKMITGKFEVKENKIMVGVIGAGSFAQDVHLPNLQKLSDIYEVYAICSKIGSEADSIAKNYNASYATTDYKDLLNDSNVNMVIITTRHNLHAKIAIEAARAGKAVFLEKPMALNKEELNGLVAALEDSKVPFMVGFNRRFSSLAANIKEILKNRTNPLIINYNMNAGYIPGNHWVHSEEGGGRNIGEACHIYDLFNFYTESEVRSMAAASITPSNEQFARNDNFSATIKYKDGSICNLTYTALGSKSAPKEQMDIFFDGKIIHLNDYRELTVFGTSNKNIRQKIQDKGHFEELKVFGDYVKSGKTENIIPMWQLIQATEISFEVENQINN